MTHTLPGADIRGYYAELGVQLPAWTHTEASVRCFADPNAHQHEDHKPSMSVNLQHGAYHCHGCGARGGAFDAATAHGHDRRAAIELMIRYGLTNRRRRSRRSARRQNRAQAVPKTRARETRRRLQTTDTAVQRWHQRLLHRDDILEQLVTSCGWSRPAISSLQLGLDDNQITIPVRDQHRQLIALVRYRPNPAPGQDKIRAAYGSQRALFPHPAAEGARHLLLVEGEPDAIAARSHRLPAIAIPGVDGWQPQWAPLFTDRQVTITFDADPAGRGCAAQVAAELATYASRVDVIDLAPERADGYDLADWLLERRRSKGPQSGIELRTFLNGRH